MTIEDDAPTVDPVVDPVAGDDSEPTVEELKERAEKAEAAEKKSAKELEAVKSAQQGSDRTNTDLRQQIEDIKSTHLTEEQRITLEKDQEAAKRELAENESQEKSRVLEEKTRALLVTEFMLDKGLPAEFRGYLSGTTEEELETQAENLQKMIADKVDAETKARLTQDVPGTGDPSQQQPASTIGKNPLETLGNAPVIHTN